MHVERTLIVKRDQRCNVLFKYHNESSWFPPKHRHCNCGISQYGLNFSNCVALGQIREENTTMDTQHGLSIVISWTRHLLYLRLTRELTGSKPGSFLRYGLRPDV
jgi:hypothetical protein